MISVVSGYVPIENHPRSQQEFLCLGDRLLGIDHRVIFTKNDIEDCWLHRYLKHHYDLDTSKFTHSVADNPVKNSLQYHITMAQKTEWMQHAATLDPDADVYVWIDFGIFHIPGITTEIIDSFLERAESERAIVIPGCWHKERYEYNDRWPCWRFCGGVMVVPRHYVDIFNFAMKREYVRWLQETGNISWEVNALARLEQRDQDFPVWWYEADHNHTLFTNYIGARHHENMH